MRSLVERLSVDWAAWAGTKGSGLLWPTDPKTRAFRATLEQSNDSTCNFATTLPTIATCGKAYVSRSSQEYMEIKRHPLAKWRCSFLSKRTIRHQMGEEIWYVEGCNRYPVGRLCHPCGSEILTFIYLGFYVAFNTVQVISRRVVGRAEETSTYSLLGFCTVNCRPTASNYQLSHSRPCRKSNPGLRGGRRECYHSATVAPGILIRLPVKSMTSTGPVSKSKGYLYLWMKNRP